MWNLPASQSPLQLLRALLWALLRIPPERSNVMRPRPTTTLTTHLLRQRQTRSLVTSIPMLRHRHRGAGAHRSGSLQRAAPGTIYPTYGKNASYLSIHNIPTKFLVENMMELLIGFHGRLRLRMRGELICNYLSLSRVVLVSSRSFMSFVSLASSVLLNEEL